MNDKRIEAIEEALSPHDLAWAKRKLSQGKIVYPTDSTHYYKVFDSQVWLRSFPRADLSVDVGDWRLSTTPFIETFYQAVDSTWVELLEEPNNER